MPIILNDLQKIPHDTVRYANNPIELLKITDRMRIGRGTDSRFDFLLHCDGSENSTSFVEETGKSVTLGGTPKITTLNKRFGSGSVIFGSSDSLICNNIMDFGANDFTIDMWIYKTDSSVAEYYRHDDQGGTGYGFAIYTATDRYLYLMLGCTTGDYYLTSSSSLNYSYNTWFHLAIVRYGAEIMAFYNGIKLTLTGTQIGTKIIVPRSGTSSKKIRNVNGQLDEIAIRNYAVWTSSFTPLSIPYVRITHHNYIGA